MGLKRFVSESVVFKTTGMVVAAGPFKGMRYRKKAIWSELSPKLLGTYEMEVNHFTERLIAAEPEQIINVGSAEGYYAVGLALRLPNTRVVAYETTEEGRQALAGNAELNAVSDRIEIRESCDTKELERILSESEHPHVVMDVEGYEKDLLDPEQVPSISKATIFVEVHHFPDFDMEKLLEDRLRDTHTVEREAIRKFSRNDIVPDIRRRIAFLPYLFVRKAIDERRGDVGCWFYMTPKQPVS